MGLCVMLEMGRGWAFSRLTFDPLPLVQGTLLFQDAQAIGSTCGSQLEVLPRRTLVVQCRP